MADFTGTITVDAPRALRPSDVRRIPRSAGALFDRDKVKIDFTKSSWGSERLTIAARLLDVDGQGAVSAMMDLARWNLLSLYTAEEFSPATGEGRLAIHKLEVREQRPVREIIAAEFAGEVMSR